MSGRPAAPRHDNDELILSIDVPLLQLLPRAGATVGKYKPLARNVKALVAAFEGSLTNGEVAGRTQVLMRLGYVTRVQLIPLSQGKGYQVTRKGEALVREHTHGKEEN